MRGCLSRLAMSRWVLRSVRTKVVLRNEKFTLTVRTLRPVASMFGGKAGNRPNFRTRLGRILQEEHPSPIALSHHRHRQREARYRASRSASEHGRGFDW